MLTRLNTILLYGIATRATASPVTHASRSSPSPTSRSAPTFDSEFLFPPKFTSLSPRIHEEGRTNERQRHESHLTRACGLGGPRHVDFVSSRAFKSPAAGGPRRRVVSLFSRLAIRSPSLARVRAKLDHCRSCQSCREQPIARARLLSIYSDDAEAACPFASSAIA